MFLNGCFGKNWLFVVKYCVIKVEFCIMKMVVFCFWMVFFFCYLVKLIWFLWFIVLVYFYWFLVWEINSFIFCMCLFCFWLWFSGLEVSYYWCSFKWEFLSFVEWVFFNLIYFMIVRWIGWFCIFVFLMGDLDLFWIKYIFGSME